VKLYNRRSSNEGWLTSYADLITNLLIFFILIISASQIQTGKMEKIIESISQNRAFSEESLSSAEKKVREELERQGLKESVAVELTDDGLTVAFNSGVTFASGSADILPEMQQPLEQVLGVIKPYAQKYRFAVEGHTDERPISNSIYKSNWELASARAMRIRERLEAVGTNPKQLRVESYADTRPVQMPNVAENERLARQRRVVIRIF
jgi:chemotaxis protein MotB